MRVRVRRAAGSVGRRDRGGAWGIARGRTALALGRARAAGRRFHSGARTAGELAAHGADRANVARPAGAVDTRRGESRLFGATDARRFEIWGI